MANKKINKRNARRKTNLSSFSLGKVWQWFRFATIMAGFGVLLGGSGYYLSQTVIKFMEKPVATVIVKGDFNYLSYEQIQELIAKEITGSFVRENLNTMRDNIEANPWVDRVNLRRQWPDKLLVNVMEQRPIARWGLGGFVNYRGELVKVQPHNLLNNLPELRGDEKYSLMIMQHYQLISELLEKHNLRIESLERSPLGMWSLLLDNQWKIIVGRTQVTKKIQQLMMMLNKQKIDNPDAIAEIDMRYESGLAVKWRSDKNLDQQEISQISLARSIGFITP